MPTKTVAGRTWHFSHSVGHHVGPGGFVHPTSVLATPDNIVYVADTGAAEGYGRARIRKLHIEDGFIDDFGTRDLVWPEGLAIDHLGNIYCSDARTHQIVVHDRNGEEINAWGSYGAEAGQLNGPSGLVVDNDNSLLVADTRNHRIQKFSTDGSAIDSWGTFGDAPGQLNRPWGLTIDQAGDVYVADWGNDRVQKFSSEGELLGQFGSTIDDGGQLTRPSDVAVDSEGDVYVADWGNHRIQIYYPDGDIICGLYGDAREFSRSAQEVMDVNPDLVAAFDRVEPTELVSWGHFERPRGIAIDDQDRIIVTDGTRGRFQVYAKDKDYIVPQFNL